MAVNKLHYVDNIKYTTDFRLIGMIVERDFVRIQTDTEKHSIILNGDIHIDIKKVGNNLRIYFIIDWE